MTKRFRSGAISAFTLIELLIVVAIIAILAAIAVPNFLEAQTRSKVARVANDIRTLRTGLESYRVDNNTYPETDPTVSEVAAITNGTIGPFRLTTPIAYLTSIPSSPFTEEFGTANPADPRAASELNGYLYTRKINDDRTISNDYRTDRRYYVFLNVGLFPQSVLEQGEWNIKSVGPNSLDDKDASLPEVANASDARPYDPTNGTVSDGDIIAFSDLNELGTVRSRN